MKLIHRYSLLKKPTLKVITPRLGTSIIPLDVSDGDILLTYLTNKVHALHFDGSEDQLKKIFGRLHDDRRFTIQKIRTSVGRGRDRLMLVHLKFPNDIEIRRVIKLT